MPFTKIGPGKYESPSGRKYNAAQVRLWYAGGGKFPGEKGPGELKAKAPKKPRAPKISNKSPIARLLGLHRSSPQRLLSGR